MTDIATLIEESGTIKFGTFTLSDGSLTDYYIDKYVFETSPSLLEPIVKEIVDRIDNDAVDVVAGPALGAVPIITAVSMCTGLEAAFIRKGETMHGTQARIEGSINKGNRILLIEDITTTGGTILESAHMVEEVGGIVEKIIVVVDRNEGAEACIEAEGYDFEYLAQVGRDINVEPA